MALAFGASVGGVSAQSRLQGPTDCFHTLQFGRDADIVCALPVRPQGKDLDGLVAASRGYVREVDCVVSIRVPRAAITAALQTPDYVFEAPAQPVACDVVANLSGNELSRHKVTAQFAPRVVFRGGVATDATPGLSLGPDISRVVSWPLEAYVNRGGAVRDGMLQAVNLWVYHLRQRAAFAR
ncbi:MAG: hypothetical protein RL291_1654 [Pseudomonadota bacterium]